MDSIQPNQGTAGASRGAGRTRRGTRGARGGGRGLNREQASKKESAEPAPKPKESATGQNPNPRPRKERCLACKQEGHWARECPQGRVHFCDAHEYYQQVDEECFYCTYHRGEIEAFELAVQLGETLGSGKA